MFYLKRYESVYLKFVSIFFFFCIAEDVFDIIVVGKGVLPPIKNAPPLPSEDTMFDNNNTQNKDKTDNIKPTLAHQYNWQTTTGLGSTHSTLPNQRPVVVDVNMKPGSIFQVQPTTGLPAPNVRRLLPLTTVIVNDDNATTTNAKPQSPKVGSLVATEVFGAVFSQDSVKDTSAGDTNSEEDKVAPKPNDSGVDDDDEADDEIERAMMEMQAKPKGEGEYAKQRRERRYSDYTLRQLPNVKRVGSNVAWQLDHRLPGIAAPLRCESPRPCLTSSATIAPRPAKKLHDLVLAQQHADEVRRNQEETRRLKAVNANRRVDYVRHGNKQQLAAMKEKLADRDQRQETKRVEQERCKTANAMRDTRRVQFVKSKNTQKAHKLKESTVDKAQRAANNLAAQKEAREQRLTQTRQKRRQIAEQAAQNEREVCKTISSYFLIELFVFIDILTSAFIFSNILFHQQGKRVPASAMRQCVSNKGAGFKASASYGVSGSSTFASSFQTSGFSGGSGGTSSFAAATASNYNSYEDTPVGPKPTVSETSLISTMSFSDDDEIDLFKDIPPYPQEDDDYRHPNAPPTAEEMIRQYDLKMKHTFDDDDDFYGTGTCVDATPRQH